MQYQKDDIRAKILESALNEFDRYGFSGAQMQKIASGAGVSTGNVYRYFKNKDGIFEAIVQSVYVYISKIIFDLYKGNDDFKEVKDFAEDIASNIMDIYRKYSRELMVIIDKSNGSKYENFTQALIQLVYQRLITELKSGHSDSFASGDILIYIVSSSFVEGLFTILRNYKDPKMIETHINRMLLFFFDNIKERINLPYG